MNIGFTSIANVYPLGICPYGCHDLSGNIWEWTRSEKGDYPYPQIKTEAWKQRTQFNKNEDADYVLRGGAFGGDPYAVRSCIALGYRSDLIGFRVVLSHYSDL